MRQAGTLASQKDAERFADFLVSQGISAKVEPADGQWTIWVHDENKVGASKKYLDDFLSNPQDERYREAERAARQARRDAAEKMRRAQKNFVDMRDQWAHPARRRPVTMALILISVVVFPLLHTVAPWFLFSGQLIQSGEVWRLVTPIFLHFGLPHIVFNMWWLYDLGGIIELKLRWLRFAGLVLAIAIPSNIAQAMATGEAFGGMSGVVYGLFGFAWVRGRLDPASGLYLRPDIAFWMIGWFVLCMGGVIGNVANWAHGVGLLAGGLLGYASHWISKLR
jgi:GlpG protein